MSLTEREEQIYNQLVRAFAPYITSVSQSIITSGTFDISKLSPELQRILVLELENIYITDSLTMSLDENLPDVDIDDIGSTASDWANRYAGGLVTGVTASIQKDIQKIVSESMSTPGMTRGDVEARLRLSAFSPARASAIAVTETTRASTAAANGLKDHYREKYDLTYKRVWQTNADELVCPICGPLNGKDEAFWGDKFPDGPPAHPNCRCSTSLRMVKPEKPAASQEQKEKEEAERRQIEILRQEKEERRRKKIEAIDNQAKQVRGGLAQARQKYLDQRSDLIKKTDEISYQIIAAKSELLALTPRIIAAQDANDIDTLRKIDEQRAKITKRRDALYKKHAATTKKANKYTNEFINKNAAKDIEKLMSVPDPKKFTPEFDETGSIFTETAKKKTRTAFDKVSKYTSDTCNVFSDTKVHKLQYGERAYCDSRTFKDIYFTEISQERTIIHELGHTFEDNKAIKQAAGEFLDRRTAGETARKMSELTGNQYYGDHEVAKPDKFYHPYVGSIYPGGLTEVISMGLERIILDPEQFATDDPEHFDLIFRIIRGGYSND